MRREVLGEACGAGYGDLDAAMPAGDVRLSFGRGLRPVRDDGE
jgi:hypothetical protein